MAAIAAPISAGAILLALGMDYYGTFYYKAFPPAEAKCYRVDARSIGKPGVLVGSAMSESASALTVFYPRNGQILRARPIQGSENWLQLLSGSYVQARHCGVPLLHEIDEPPQMGNMNMIHGPPLTLPPTPPFAEEELKKT
jgi:hypothetical protein